MKKRANLFVKLTALAVALAVAWLMSAVAWAESAQEGEKKPTYIELTQALMRANIEMNNRDRTGDAHIYQIGSDHFVSEEDVQALMHVLEARKALQQVAGFDKDIIEPDEEFVREFLFVELLIQAKADEMGITDLKESLMWYMKKGWLEPEPPTPDASDTEALVRQAWIRFRLLRNDLASAQNTKLPYEGSAALIDDLIRALKGNYTAS